MTGDEAYRWLIAGAAADADPFDTHVAASILALAIAEGGPAGRVLEQAGLTRADMGVLAQRMFPGRAAGLTALAAADPPAPEDEQAALAALLSAHVCGSGPLGPALARMIARRAMEPGREMSAPRPPR